MSVVLKEGPENLGLLLSISDMLLEQLLYINGFLIYIIHKVSCVRVGVKIHKVSFLGVCGRLQQVFCVALGGKFHQVSCVRVGW